MRVHRNRRQFLTSLLAVPLSGALPTVLQFSSRSPSQSSLLASDAPSTRAEKATPEDRGSTWSSFRNGQSNHGISETKLREKLERQWEFNLPEGSASTPVIADGTVYIGTLGGNLHALDLKTGELQWTYASLEDVPANSFAPGFNAAATLNESTIYIGDDQGGFHAVDRKSGKRRWFIETNGEIVGGAQLYGDNVIFGSHDGYLYSYRAATGEKVWACETLGPVNATPCIANGFTFTTGCDKPILRVIDLEKGVQHSEIPLDALLLAATAEKDDILYFGTDGGKVFAVEWKTKKIVWQYDSAGRDNQIHSSPAITDKHVIIGSRDKRLNCLSRETGELMWSVTCRAKVDGSPVVCGEMVLFGSSDKNFYAVSLNDGSVLMKDFVRNAVTGSPAVADGHVVIATEATNGKLICYR